ncbi:MAG: NUDIX hydrolase [Chloroflexota bacterium]|nr:NUDIX hydrolase [Chloroflexota bacterium]
MERYRTMRAYSAGGVVFHLTPARSSGQQHILQEQFTAGDPHTDNSVNVEIVLVGRRHAGIWTLPKGTPQAGETIEQVAIREAQEETGLLVRLVTYIGSISYSFTLDQVRYHKQVRHFLLEAIGGDIALHDHEYDQVQWFPWDEACRVLTYQNEVHILYQAEAHLQRWLQQYRQQKGKV